MGGRKTRQASGNVIAVNRRARHEYFIEDTLEAGLALEGWEVKSLRDGRAQIAEAYVILKSGEAWLVGAHISPLTTTATHIKPDPVRSRKLLLHRRELDRLAGAVERRGYALVPLELRWKKGRAKLDIGLARGKKQHDKRETLRRKEAEREIERALRTR